MTHSRLGTVVSRSRSIDGIDTLSTDVSMATRMTVATSTPSVIQRRGSSSRSTSSWGVTGARLLFLAKVEPPFRFTQYTEQGFRMPTTSATSTERPLRADAQRNRRRVLDAAEELFAEAGNGATIEDIAKRAGVGVGTVCRHFPTKQALLDEVLTESFRELVADADAALASDEPALAFEPFVHQLAGHQARRRMLAEQMATELELPPAAIELRSAMRAGITELLGRAQAAGAIRADISPADTAMLFAGIAQITAIAGGSAAIRDRYVTVMLDGLRPEAATPLPGRPLQYHDV